MTIDALSYDDFAPHVNTKFRARLGDAPAMEIELIGAEDKSPSARQEQFVLTFLAPREAPARQSLFEVEHEHLGGGVIFLVPVAKDERGVSYEAIFNRKIEAAR
ncbi:MAG: DUF6916 family protein [Blastocatellia bacterium]